MEWSPELTPVREHHRFDEGALAAYLSETLGGDFSGMAIEQFEGGQSNPTFLIRNGSDSYVMRKKPPGVLLKSAHAVEREYRVMDALYDTDVPVPKMHALCEDASVIGTPFFVMEHVAGRVVPSIDLPYFSPSDRGAVYADFARVLAALHGVDYKAIGLDDFGREGNYFARQISRWSKQYAASKTEEIPEMDSLIAWLSDHVPESDETAIVHGDYRIGNCVLHPTEPRIVAVLDWELATTGHPLGDLGYYCMGYHHFRDGIEEFPEAGSGIPSEQAFVDMYCEASGRGPIERWPFYISYNLFRTAAILQGVYRRGLDGNASSEKWPTYGEEAKVAAACGWKLAQAMGA